ncbi:MAG: hypothetical protein HYY96_13910 [Candidatus Tectomicrobia bacterium]|nr:hypothetical protein [Candidatus Tectomicrobia bacterium]
MSVEKLEAVERRLVELLERLTDYRTQNAQLQRRVEELERRVQEQDALALELHNERGEYDTLLHENKRLLEERDIVSSRIESLLEKLEELDL